MSNVTPELVDLISTVCECRLFVRKNYYEGHDISTAMIGRHYNSLFFNTDQLKLFNMHILTCTPVGSSSERGYLFLMASIFNGMTNKYRAVLFDILGNQILPVDGMWVSSEIDHATNSDLTMKGFWRWFTNEFDQLGYYIDRIQKMQCTHARRASECAEALNVLTIKQGDVWSRY